MRSLVLSGVGGAVDKWGRGKLDRNVGLREFVLFLGWKILV